MWIFLIGSVLIFNAAAFFVRKRLPRAEIYATVMFALFMATTVDTYASHKWKTWGFFFKDQAEYEALWVILGIYPAASVLIINWYPYASRWSMKIIFILGWAVFSTLYEAATIKFGIIWHGNWNLWKSLLLYPPIYYMLILQLHVYRWIISKGKKG